MEAPTFEDVLAGKIPKLTQVTLAANGCMYRKDKQGFIPALMELKFAQRAEYNKKKKAAEKAGDELEASRWDAAQLAKKIQLNSLYGALGNEAFRYYNANHAEAVTLGGQLTLKWAENVVNKFLNAKMGTEDYDYVLYGDTDSLYLDMQPIVDKFVPKAINSAKVDFLNKIGDELLGPAIARGFDELGERMNVYKQAMEMKREVISDKSIWEAKKRYIVNVLDSEGKRFDEPKLKIKGMEAVRSGTPDTCREAIIESVKIMLSKTEDDVRDYVTQFKEKWMTWPFDMIASPRGVNGLDKYYDAATLYTLRTPIHVKGSLIYNKLIKEKGLTGLEPIFNGAKIKFCYLQVPNPTNDTVIAAPGFLPEALGLDAYLDREMQFEKAFLEPLKGLLQVVGWQYERKANLEDFF
jgi:hypothetical protein